jgi:chorismate-pyruvate lyase
MPETCFQHSLTVLPVVERLLLTTDGTVTSMLEHITGESITTACLTRKSLSESDVTGLSPLLVGAGPVQLRTVRLMGLQSRRIYVKARSLIVVDALPDAVRSDLDSTDTPIGVLLRRYRVESYRELLNYQILSDELTRAYQILHCGRTALLIQERFLRECFQAIRR